MRLSLAHRSLNASSARRILGFATLGLICLGGLDNLAAQSITELYSFATTTGDVIVDSAGLIQGSDGRLYGARPAPSLGNIFAVNADGTGLTTLHSFANNGGPTSLIQGSDGRLYGTTIGGGASGSDASNKGTIFAVNTDGTGFATLHSFTGGNDGANPYGGLIQLGDGRLYGTATYGGADADGTVFVVNTDGTGFTTLYTFTGGTDGSAPCDSLIQGSDGRLYGTACGGDGGAMLSQQIGSWAA
jgi:uncharacterized repeat protein (TIGR03803 family)